MGLYSLSPHLLLLYLCRTYTLDGRPPIVVSLGSSLGPCGRIVRAPLLLFSASRENFSPCLYLPVSKVLVVCLLPPFERQSCVVGTPGKKAATHRRAHRENYWNVSSIHENCHKRTTVRIIVNARSPGASECLSVSVVYTWWLQTVEGSKRKGEKEVTVLSSSANQARACLTSLPGVCVASLPRQLSTTTTTTTTTTGGVYCSKKEQEGKTLCSFLSVSFSPAFCSCPRWSRTQRCSERWRPFIMTCRWPLTRLQQQQWLCGPMVIDWTG